MRDFLFVNLNPTYTLLFILFLYTIICVLDSTTMYSFLWYNFLVFLLCTSLLYLHNLELITSLLLISELVVFFYIFLALITSNLSFLTINYNSSIVPLFIFALFSFPLYNGFYHYCAIDWYYTIYSPNNDVFGIYFYFFYLNWPALFFIGILLLVVTYFICFFTIYFYTYLLDRRRRLNSKQSFFKKFQSKKVQVNKEPSFFTNNFFK